MITKAFTAPALISAKPRIFFRSTAVSLPPQVQSAMDAAQARNFARLIGPVSAQLELSLGNLATTLDSALHYASNPDQIITTANIPANSLTATILDGTSRSIKLTTAGFTSHYATTIRPGDYALTMRLGSRQDTLHLTVAKGES